MLFRKAELDRIAAGEIRLAFRRWQRPSVKPGGTLTTPVGVLSIESVEQADEAGIGEVEARLAGAADRDALLARLAGREGTLYRIAFHLRGSDPRKHLAENARIGPEAVDDIARRLARLDRAARNGPWTRSTLEAIAAAPGCPARLLASASDRSVEVFKKDVRKLKALGLVESLETGYRLSPRGGAFLKRLP